MRMDTEAIHGRIANLLRSRKRFVVATIIDVKGSCPQKPGARMIIHPDGKYDFTIGGGTFESEVIQDALSVFGESVPVNREYKLTKPELGMYCQGLVKVLFENYLPRPQVLIFGGGHVGQALSKLAAASELFSVIVIDDRKEYASVKKHMWAGRVIHTDRNFIKGVPRVDENTYVVIVTRCHATDKILVKRHLGKSAAYVGLIGSQAKIKQFRRELEEEGVQRSLLESLHAPIGLPIGGKAPAEVAISILAELIQRKNTLPESKAASFQIKKQRP